MPSIALSSKNLEHLSLQQRSTLEGYASFFILPDALEQSETPLMTQITLAGQKGFDLLVTSATPLDVVPLEQFLSALSRSLSPSDSTSHSVVPSTAIILGSSTSKRSFWQGVYFRTARFWFRLFSQRTLQAPTSSLIAYNTAALTPLRCKASTAVIAAQELLLLSEETGLTIEEVDLGPLPLEVVSFRKLSPLIPLYTRALFRHMAREFSYGSFEGKGVFQKIHLVLLAEIKAHRAPQKAALALAVGTFWGLTPFHGFQVVSGFVSALYLRLNRPLVFVGLNVSFAPFLLVLIPLATAFGELLLPGSISDSFREAMASGEVRELWKEGLGGIKYYLVGSLAMAPLGGIIVFFVSYLLFGLFERLYDSSAKKA